MCRRHLRVICDTKMPVLSVFVQKVDFRLGVVIKPLLKGADAHLVAFSLQWWKFGKNILNEGVL